MTFNTYQPFFSSTVGGTVGSTPFAMNLLGANASYTIDPGGANQMVLAIGLEPPPGWVRPSAIMVIPRNAPLTITFTPGDSASPTAIVLYSYAAATNSTVEVECLAAAGASTFTVSADSLANMPPTYQIVDGSYTNLFVGTLGVNKAVSFTNGLAANGILLDSSWLAQSVAIQ